MKDAKLTSSPPERPINTGRPIFFGPRLYGLGGFGFGDAELAAFPVAAMPVAREGRGTIAFERDAGEVVEGEADRRFEYVLQVCFESAPVAGQRHFI